MFGYVDDPESPDHGGHFIQCPHLSCGASIGLRYANGDDPRPLLAEAWNRRRPARAALTPLSDVDGGRGGVSGVSDQIKADLGRKCADDVGAALKRTAMLLDTPQDRFMVALYATATAAGAAVGYGNQCMPGSAPEEAVDTLWEVLRPMILMTAGGGSSDFRTLLRRAPKGDGSMKRRRRP